MNKKNEESKIDISQLANLPLKEYYGNLPAGKRKIIFSPKQELLKTIADLTGRTPASVQRWCLGDSVPPPHVQKKIAEYFKTTTETLFPEVV